MSDDARFQTRAIHVGQAADVSTGATVVPVYQTTTYTQDAIGQHKGFEYSRGANPTRHALEAALASLEGARFGLTYASGMAAIHGVMTLLRAGDHVVVCDDLYGGSYRLFTTVMSGFGVQFTFVDATRPAEVENAIQSTTRMLWMESPTNPMLRLIDIAACGDIAARRDLKLVVDNTFATPYLQNPLELGAHIVVHSTTKYIGGHSDVIGGAVIVDDEELAARLKFNRNASGGIPGPWDAWLTLRGVKTLAIRMNAHAANAGQIAEFLTGRPEVRRVHYPGLPPHPGHLLAASQMRGFGGVVTIELAGGAPAAHALCGATEYFALTEGLGGVESQIGYPWSMSHGASPPNEKLSKGITEGTVRLSVGIEHVDDLCEDLERALQVAGA